MWVWLVVLVLVPLLPSSVQAVYTDAVVVSNEVQVDGRTLIVLRIRGDAQEPDVQLKYNVPANPTMAELRHTIGERVAELNLARTVASAPAVRPGAVIAPLTRPAAPAPTAKQIWQGKFDRYNRMNGSGIAAATAQITALKADLEATYQAGYLD